MSNLKNFLNNYDSGDLKFNNLQYRKGARISSFFGLSEGYRFVNGKMVFDTVRIHSGVDRGKSNKSGTNVVVAPFDFNRSEFLDYGEDHVYGSMLRLFNDDYGFEMRIIHLYPSEIETSVMEIFKNKGAIKHGTIIGCSGSYGSASSGRHTHTEFISIQESCLIFDDLLELKYREDAFLPYTEDYVINFYKSKEFWKDEKRFTSIIKDFKHQLEKRKIKNNMLNRYSYCYSDWYYGYDGYHTRYSSEKLFNGL